MRKAAADLEFEEAARRRDEIKRLKILDLEFANAALTPEGKQVDRNCGRAPSGVLMPTCCGVCDLTTNLTNGTNAVSP